MKVKGNSIEHVFSVCFRLLDFQAFNGSLTNWNTRPLHQCHHFILCSSYWKIGWTCIIWAEFIFFQAVLFALDITGVRLIHMAYDGGRHFTTSHHQDSTLFFILIVSFVEIYFRSQLQSIIIQSGSQPVSPCPSQC